MPSHPKAHCKLISASSLAWLCLAFPFSAEPGNMSLHGQDQFKFAEYYAGQSDQIHITENILIEPDWAKQNPKSPNIHETSDTKDSETLLTYLKLATGIAALTSLLTLLLLKANLKLRQENRLRVAEESEIQKLAFLDTLTGLSNRHNFFSLANHTLKLAHRDERKLAVLFIDLNDFKLINDKFGHKAGDLVLAQIGHTLRNFIRESDIAARLGGDEFALLLNNIHSKEDIFLSLQKIQQIVCQPIAYMDQELTVSASIGLAVFPDDALDIDGLLDIADTHMYQIKSEGKGSESTQTNFF